MKKTKATTVGAESGSGKKFLINIGVTLVVGFVYFYTELPALNFKNEGFYFFFFLLAAVYCATAIVTSGIWKLRGEGQFWKSVKNNCKVPLLICAVFALTIVIGSVLSSVLLRARAYSEMLDVTASDFVSDVSEISYDEVPLLDKDSAEMLGDRKLGELADMVSQFEVSSDYTQINYNGKPVRVTPLEYGDVIKWITNRTEGVPAYIMIDMVTQNAEVVRLSEGMKYLTTEHFSRNVYRHLRFSYPTFMFDQPSFEIDDDGTPYWVCPRVVKTIGLFGGTDINGVVLMNAITGECEYYEEAPTWVDRAYNADLIIAQYDYYGKYQKGYLNSIFGQRGVTVTTDGYNYIAMDDDVWMYTGVTSVGTDLGNVGFILSNMRTKETRFYAIAGAEEYSAMASAEGVVQHLSYNATFPLLLNIENEPTYIMALKDAAGLVKMYAMVDVSQYQIVATGTSVPQCEQNYKQLLIDNSIIESVTNQQPAQDTSEATGVITEIRSAVIEGNTVYYVKLDGAERFYTVSASISDDAVIADVGDTAHITYVKADGGSVKATAFEITAFAG